MSEQEEMIKEDIIDETNDNKEKKENKKETKKEKKDKYETLKEDYNLMKESYLKSIAELENYKKRTNEEKIRDRKYASTNLIHDLLLPLEQLKKTVEMDVADEKLKNFLIGFKMISNNIYSVLSEDGLTEIESINKQFDPNFHYAVEKTNDPNVENGIITEVVQTGYMYKERILRPAMVKVNEWSETKDE